MKRFDAFVFVAVYLLLPPLLFAQSIVDPADSFYRELRVWETLGLVSNLPPLRPYPEPVVRSLLARVINGDNAAQRERARAQQERLFGKKIRVGAAGTGSIALRDAKDGNADDTDAQLDVSLLSTGHFSTADFDEAPHRDEAPFRLWMSYDLNLLASNKKPGDEIVPEYSGYRYDTYQDDTSVGPAEIFASFNSAAAAGTEKLWFQAGMSRSSWGSFYDNGVVISPEAAHTGNMSLVLSQPSWNYTLAFFMLSASTDAGDYPYPEKFMAMHAIGLSPLKWLEITYYENAVYGKRIEPLYFLPISPYMVSQQLNGYAEDNIQMGLELRLKPVSGVSWATNLFVDDLEFGDVVRFNFDTKIRVAVQTGLSWAPRLPLVSLLSLDYTLVTPYTYAHYDYSESTIDGEIKPVNYQNYTHNGKNLGAAIPPNSDRVHLAARFAPADNLRLDATFTFIRHANVNESLPAEYIEKYLTLEEEAGSRTDGGVMDAPNAGDGQFPLSHHKLFFMEQDTKQYIFQAGLDAAWDMARFASGSVSLFGGCHFEYIYNDGVDRDMFPGLGAAYNPENLTREIAAAKAAWKAQLRNTVNTYITIGVKYMY